MRGTAIAAAILAALLLLCLDGVDHRPYFAESYYADTAARFRAAAETNKIARGTIEVGFGLARLNPEINSEPEDPAKGKFRAVPLAGYGSRKGRPASGTHDDLFIKAVAVRVAGETVIMFGADALIVPKEVADLAAAELNAQLGLRREQLYFSATHTHCSIGGWGEGLIGEAFTGEFQPGARTWFANQLVTAARSAHFDLKQGEFGNGGFLAREYVRNRLVGKAGVVDPEFSFALFKQTGGRSAVLGAYSAHATVLPGSAMDFSGDYPGYWQRAIEKATDGMAVFLAGCVGSHGPVPGAPGYEGAQKMGEALARLTLESLPRTATTNVITFGLAGLDLTLPSQNMRLTDGIRLRPWLSTRIMGRFGPTFLQAVRFENSIWLSTPCDFSGELAIPIKESFRTRGFSTTITSFNGDYIGYVIPLRYYHMSGYEPRLMSFYGPYVPEYLTEWMRALASEVCETPPGF